MITGISCPLRFPGQLNNSYRKLLTNITAFPRLHYFNVGFCPLPRTRDKHNNMVLYKAIDNLVFNSNRGELISSIDPKNGKYIAASLLFRGDM